MLDKLRADLGLLARCVLTAELHAMLVYRPGQFFAPHQDSEKTDTMIGTLVVMLPSDSQGGALVVEHGGTSTTCRPSRNCRNHPHGGPVSQGDGPRVPDRGSR